MPSQPLGINLERGSVGAEGGFNRVIQEVTKFKKFFGATVRGGAGLAPHEKMFTLKPLKM